ncbi:TPA: YSIRK-type signal peptide-containing protein, partial [Streptococcus suis]|nr:YSIRK-type signal peptide-containing protein [Streptococcus suis]
MNQRLCNKRQRFSIRKYHFGAASVLVGALLLLGQGTVSASENIPSNVELGPVNLSRGGGDSVSEETQIASMETEESANQQSLQAPSVEPQSPATVSVDPDNNGSSAVAEETGDFAENASAPISDGLVSAERDSESLDTKTPDSLYAMRSAPNIETRSAEERAAYVGSERSAESDVAPMLRNAAQLADKYEIPGNKFVYMVYTGENTRPDEILKQGLVLKDKAAGEEITDKATIEALVKSVELGVYNGSGVKVNSKFPNSAAGMGTRLFKFNYKVTFVDGSVIDQIKTTSQNKLNDGMPTNSLYVLPGLTMEAKQDLVYEIGTDVPLSQDFEALKQFYTATIAAEAFDTLKSVVASVNFKGPNVVGDKLKTDAVGSYEVQGGFSVIDQKTQQNVADFSLEKPFSYRVIDKGNLREEIEKEKDELTAKLYNDATQTTKDTYDKALAQANLVEQDPKTTQELIDKARAELEKARLGLELQPVV